VAPRESFGPYVIHEALGVGGMATVHRAERTGADGYTKQIALKRMLPALADSDEGLSYFLREAKLASYLRHANVASTYEVGEIRGTYFIAMELIEGKSLHLIMHRCAETATPMPLAVALAILHQILDALDYAHNLTDHTGQPLGIIHRDVSPSNIIVADTGVAKLIDFGIAKASAAGMQTMNVTLKGKWAYMAPEYVELGEIDARADLVAAGVLAHEMLVGRTLFSADDDLATLERLRTLPIPPPSQANRSVPPELDHIVMAALARDPDQRWQQASAMRSALAVVTQRLGLEVGPPHVARWLGDLFSSGATDVMPAVKPPDDEELLELAPEAPPAIGTPPVTAPRRTAPLGSQTPPASTAPVQGRSLAQLLNDTNPVPAIRGSNLPRAMTGAEPLTDFETAPVLAPRVRVPTPPAPAVVVSVHEKKAVERREKARRGLIIAASLIVTLALAAVAYFLLV
jgi:serine/threonine protein kinase